MAALGSGGYTLLAFALVISAVVFFHELGHLLVGKWLGVRAVRFSLGFGPKLFGFHLGETEYRLSALPLGGYVKFAGDNPYEEVAAEDRGRGFLEQPPWKRAVIAAAGPVANFVLAIVVTFILFAAPHADLAAKVGYVKPESPAAHAGLRYGDKVLAVDGEKVEGWLGFREKIENRGGEPLVLSIERDGKPVEVQIVPAVHTETNPIETVQRGRIGISAVPRAAEVTVNRDGSALQTFDVVTRVDGQPVANWEELSAKLAQRDGPVEVDALRRMPVDAPGGTVWATAPIHVTLTPPYALTASDLTLFAIKPGSAAEEAGLERGDRVVGVDGRPIYGFDDLDAVLKSRRDAPVAIDVQRGGERIVLTVRQHMVEGHDEAGVRVKLPELGAAPDYAAIGAGDPISVRYGFAEAARHGVVDTFGNVRTYALGIARIVTGHISSEAIGGPIMIATVARKAAEAGWMALLQTIAGISIALGVMNLLPVPVLDGFHVLSAALEGIRRRPLSLRFREVANVVGIALLLCLMLFAFKNDLFRQ